jgi:hypothetical protein
VEEVTKATKMQVLAEFQDWQTETLVVH